MKKHLIIYAVLIVLYICFNLFIPLQDERTGTAANILFAGIIFGYLAYMAWVLLKKISGKG